LQLGCFAIDCSSGSATTALYAAHPDGNVLWRFSSTSSISGSQVFCCLYYTVSSPAVDARGVVYFGGADGNLYAVKPDGSLSWKFALRGAISSSPAIDLGSTIYVGSSDGNLYAIGSAAQ
jgi:outer membrane protein assembly factor BamB